MKAIVLTSILLIFSLFKVQSKTFYYIHVLYPTAQNYDILIHPGDSVVLLSWKEHYDLMFPCNDYSGPMNAIWSLNNIQLNSIPTDTIIVTDTGYVTFSSSVTPMHIHFANSISVEEFTSQNILTLLNNPASEQLMFKVNDTGKQLKYRLLDKSGRELQPLTLIATYNEIISLNVSYLKSGVYFLEISDGEKRFVEKFVRYME